MDHYECPECGSNIHTVRCKNCGKDICDFCGSIIIYVEEGDED